MLETTIYDVVNRPNELEKKEVVNFLFDNLEKYGDPKPHIEKAVDYSIKAFTSFGGFTMLLKENQKIKAAVVINQTGMGGTYQRISWCTLLLTEVIVEKG